MSHWMMTAVENLRKPCGHGQSLLSLDHINIYKSIFQDTQPVSQTDKYLKTAMRHHGYRVTLLWKLSTHAHLWSDTWQQNTCTNFVVGKVAGSDEGPRVKESGWHDGQEEIITLLRTRHRLPLLLPSVISLSQSLHVPHDEPCPPTEPTQGRDNLLFLKHDNISQLITCWIHLKEKLW